MNQLKSVSWKLFSDLATHFSEKFTHFRITQNGWLREIATDMSLRQCHLL